MTTKKMHCGICAYSIMLPGCGDPECDCSATYECLGSPKFENSDVTEHFYSSTAPVWCTRQKVAYLEDERVLFSLGTPLWSIRKPSEILQDIEHASRTIKNAPVRSDAWIVSKNEGKLLLLPDEFNKFRKKYLPENTKMIGLTYRKFRFRWLVRLCVWTLSKVCRVHSIDACWSTKRTEGL